MTSGTPNKKPAAATIRDRLYLVSTTTPQPFRKDRSNGLVHLRGVRV